MNYFLTRFHNFNSAEQLITIFLVIVLVLMILEPIFAWLLVTAKKQQLDKKRTKKDDQK